MAYGSFSDIIFIFFFFFLSCSLRSSREKDVNIRKSWCSVEMGGGHYSGCSPPSRPIGGTDEQRSLASDDSLGHISNILPIPRQPPQYEVSSSLGYTSCARGTGD